ncbi:manganese ABC transporter ATP-binding protein [Arthrospira sp. O9.13F]|nr:manganese ABC transporter ATP-binding protein [Arthrospira sp. O9.13F]
MDTLKIAHNSFIKQVSADMSIIISNLGVQYRGIEALRDINLQVNPGRLTGIIGPNGAGKSTLLKAILGLIPATGSPAIFGERPLSQQRHRVAYVPQRSQIDWTYPATVGDVVRMGRVRQTGWFRGFSGVSRRLATQALQRVGMDSYSARPIGQLPGGQQQRVFLASTLAQQAEVFCFDEPFAGIDQKTENVIFSIFRELAASGKIVLVVNHDLGKSITNFDDLILLNKELIAAGTREAVLTQENLDHAYGGRVMFFSDNAA